MPLNHGIGRTTIPAVLVLIALSAACSGVGGLIGGGGSSDLSSPTAPTNPANTNLSGNWTGTITRPSGRGTIALRWTATQDASGILSGPIAMTINGVTLPATFSGIFSGGTNNPGGIMFRITMNKGDSSAFPNCSVSMNVPGTIAGFSPAATSLSSDAFTMGYTTCQGVVEPTPPMNYTIESGNTMSLNR